VNLAIGPVLPGSHRQSLLRRIHCVQQQLEPFSLASSFNNSREDQRQHQKFLSSRREHILGQRAITLHEPRSPPISQGPDLCGGGLCAVWHPCSDSFWCHNDPRLRDDLGGTIAKIITVTEIAILGLLYRVLLIVSHVALHTALDGTDIPKSHLSGGTGEGPTKILRKKEYGFSIA